MGCRCQDPSGEGLLSSSQQQHWILCDSKHMKLAARHTACAFEYMVGKAKKGTANLQSSIVCFEDAQQSNSKGTGRVKMSLTESSALLTTQHNLPLAVTCYFCFDKVTTQGALYASSCRSTVFHTFGLNVTAWGVLTGLDMHQHGFGSFEFIHLLHGHLQTLPTTLSAPTEALQHSTCCTKAADDIGYRN